MSFVVAFTSALHIIEMLMEGQTPEQRAKGVQLFERVIGVFEKLINKIHDDSVTPAA